MEGFPEMQESEGMIHETKRVDLNGGGGIFVAV